jgi:hypothetical protein
MNKIKNDIQLLDVLRANLWVIHGAGFKKTDTFTAKSINERLLSNQKQGGAVLFCPSLDDSEMFWMATKKTADWQLL